MFYFAYIDANNVCQDVYAMPSDLSSIPGYITITEEQYTSRSVVGQVYDPVTQTWSDVPEWSCNATEVQYGEGAESVKDKLDAIDAALEGKVDASALEGKANTSDLHNHDNKTVLDGITAEKVALWDAGTASGGTTVVSMTPAEILEKLATVDGQNSGLDADLLDGHNSDYFATAEQLSGKANAEHTHTGYAPEAHTHEGYATAEHTHTGYAAEGHIHTGYASVTDLAGKADTNHAHNDYITALTYANGMSGKADSDHTHTPASIGAAPSNHSHNGYAISGHTHSDYLPKSGGTVSGDLNVTGIFRVNGQQSVYDSGTMVTLSTNNRETMIAGSKIYSKVAISVSSDRRLKENIKEVSADDMTKFINGLGIKTFNYIGNDEECIGVIAQEVTESNPELAKYFVRQDEEGYYSVKASDLVFPLIATVQKLAKEIEELKK